MSKNTVASGAETTQTLDEDLPFGVGIQEATTYSRIPHWLLEAGVSGEAIKVYAWLMKWASYETSVAVFNVSTLAEKIGKTRRSATNYLRELKEAGALRVTPRYSGNEQVASFYTVVFDDPGKQVSQPQENKQPDPRKQVSHNSRTYIQEPSVQEESEPADSDAVIEPEVVDEAEETQTRLLDALDDAVESNGFKRPGRTKANQRAMRLLLTKDGYTETQVSWMIGWATDHHFWYKNIRSAEKLRQQFDRLVVEAKEQHGGGPAGGMKPNSAEQRVEDHRSVREKMIQLQAEMDAKTGGQHELG